MELKKKYQGVVYKRRESFRAEELTAFLADGVTAKQGQIVNELRYALHYYRYPKPRAALYYEREAYFYRGEEGVRLTFDRGIRCRFEELSPACGTHGRLLLPEDSVILEIKCGGAMPLRLAHLLDRCGLFPTSFSKYGTAYTQRFREGTLPLSISV